MKVNLNSFSTSKKNSNKIFCLFIYKLRVKESNAKQQQKTPIPSTFSMENEQQTTHLMFVVHLLSHDSSSQGTFAFSLALSFSFASLTLSSFSSFSTFAWYVGSTPTWVPRLPTKRATLGLPGLPVGMSFQRTSGRILESQRVRPSHDILEILFFKNPQFESQFQVVGFFGSRQLALDLKLGWLVVEPTHLKNNIHQNGFIFPNFRG